MLRRQVATFLVVGCVTMAIDYAAYHLLVRVLAAPVDVAKAIGFVLGTACAYFANRHFTFASQEAPSGSGWRFLFLYGATLAVNVGTNGAALRALGALGTPGSLQVAFLFATAVSATLNFIGMKCYVFRPRRG